MTNKRLPESSCLDSKPDPKKRKPNDPTQSVELEADEPNQQNSVVVDLINEEIINASNEKILICTTGQRTSLTIKFPCNLSYKLKVKRLLTDGEIDYLKQIIRKKSSNEFRKHVSQSFGFKEKLLKPNYIGRFTDDERKENFQMLSFINGINIGWKLNETPGNEIELSNEMVLRIKWPQHSTEFQIYLASKISIKNLQNLFKFVSESRCVDWQILSKAQKKWKLNVTLPKEWKENIEKDHKLMTRHGADFKDMLEKLESCGTNENIIHVKYYDFEGLRWWIDGEGAWLNDQIINKYFRLICDRNRRENALKKVHAMDVFFVQDLLGGNHENVKIWTKNVNIFQYDMVLVPVQQKKHWTSAIIHMENKSIKYYDSTINSGTPNNGVLNALEDYIAAESRDKKGVAFNFTVENVTDIPEQTNGYDCGEIGARRLSYR